MTTPCTETVIEPRRHWWTVDIGLLIRYRNLTRLFARRDITVKYKQTILGPLWFILQPLLTTMVFTVVFNRIGKIPTDGIPPFLFYLCGQLAWNYFAQTFNATSNTFVVNANLFGKVYFPRLCVPLSIGISNLLPYVIQLMTFLAVFMGFKYFSVAGPGLVMGWKALLLPLLLVQTCLLAVGCGLWMSSFTAKYRDFTFLMGFFTQLWMFATPIVYPMSQVPERMQAVVALNPMAPVVEFYRMALLGQGTVSWGQWGVAFLISLVAFYTGILMFQRVERTFVDTV